MCEKLRRLRKRKKVRKAINRIMDHPEDALIIHYSCESFYDRVNGKTPRVTSIAVRSLDSGQTKSFSIHKIAEQKGIAFGEIHNHYDELEKEMLEEYFHYANENQGKTWIHWNMRDINYGFIALEHRHKVLEGTPFIIPEDKKFDFARAMVSLYGVGYIGHPRLVKLVKKNKISDRDMLTGAEEAEAFENKEYVKLHQSTLKKVDILANIFGRAVDGTIKTNSKWYEIYGIHPKILVELVRKHWLYWILGFVVLIWSLIQFFHYILTKRSI